MSVSKLLSVARGDRPADLLLRNCRIVNVFSGEIEPGHLAIVDGIIAGIGHYEANKTIDLEAAFVAPGLIDAHVHIESSLCLPAQFAAAVVPRGVTTVVADPHEIANVAGAAGVKFMHASSRGIPLNVVLMAPSCVPATKLSTNGATLAPRDLGKLPCHGLAEVMNFPGAINGDADVLKKLALFRGKPIDGHAPGVRKQALNAYAAAGIGSDHECVTVEEAREKLARGMYVLIREATNARNLDALIPLITPANARRICLCTDDRTPVDLLADGSIDYMLRRVIAAGVDPILAFQLCTLNPAEWFGLADRGAIAPGRAADLFIFDDIRLPVASSVFVGGKLVAADGKLTVKLASRAPRPRAVINSCRIQPAKIDLRVPARGERVRVIGSRIDQLLTESRAVDVASSNGEVTPDAERDLLKIAVIERHRGTGRVGLGFIEGFGLDRGAIAGTVAHDHHNLVVIGCDDESMHTAIAAIAKMGGGLVVTEGEELRASLPLPIAGLMSDKPVEQVRQAYQSLLDAAKSLGSALHDPFMAMSFMALEVIPSLKLTDCGLVDVEQFKIVDLFVKQ